MFEPLLSRLSDRYHLVAPDDPGFGHSDWPDPKKFAYAFDHISEIMSHFTEALGLLRSTLYMHDYGGPVGFRMALVLPECLQAKLSSSRTRSRTTKVLARIGRLGANFGKIGRPTKRRFAQTRQHAHDTSGTIPMSIAMIRICGRMNLIFSISQARPSFKSFQFENLSYENNFLWFYAFFAAPHLIAFTSLGGSSPSHHVYELRMYHVNERKMNALIARFGDHTDAIFKRHNMKSIGYWVSEDAPNSENLFVSSWGWLASVPCGEAGLGELIFSIIGLGGLEIRMAE
jgi:pimeloyl-ACP methyl ester carboxylesterase